MTNEEKANELALLNARQYHHNTYPEISNNSEFVYSVDECKRCALQMAEWKDEQQNHPITEHTEEANLELELDKLTLDNMKGFVSRTTLASYQRITLEPKMEIVEKALVAITVISAKDYKPHAMLSVIVNGNETAFGTDTKKAIEFYNKA